jgi:lipopolysaccharide export system protein LptA
MKKILMAALALIPLMANAALGAPAKNAQGKIAPAQATASGKQPTPVTKNANPGVAPDANAPRDEGTLEVTSDHDLEWLQQDHAYIARGNAVAKRGTVTLMADLLIAYYRPLARPGAPAREVAPAKPGAAPQTGFDSGNTEIWRVLAVGNVHIVSEDRDAWGDRADYDKDKSVIVLTGQHLLATTLTETVTARDSLEYWQDLDMAVARGNALIVKVDGDRLAADVIAGHFVKDATNQTVLKTIEGKGHVVVTTFTDVVHGDEGTYDLPAQHTVLFGNIKATHGESELEGASADVNMVTGISQVFPAAGQRVRGLFVHTPAASQPAPAPGKS